jgi:uncharacterized protein YneR
MRKTISLGLAIAMLVSLFAFVGCKKGENDPISLLTRKARITGEWELVEASWTNTSPGGSVTYTYSGTNMTWAGGGGSYTYGYSEAVTINKDGTFEVQVTETHDGGTVTITIEGVWYFLDGSKEIDVKDKERVEMLVTSFTQTGFGDTDTASFGGASVDASWSDRMIMILLLDRLANKEMTVLFDAEETWDGERWTQSGEKMYEKK